MMRLAAALLATAAILAGCEGPKSDDVGQDPKKVVYDEELQKEVRPSDNLDADRNRMWHTVPLVSDPHPSPRTVPPAGERPPPSFEVSPVSAINAASRVFATIQLAGMTAQNAAIALGARPRPKYGYDFPFWPADKGIVVYRFDCGSFGWQFNVSFDAEGHVAKVERLWIH
jgi:hypothetical protein